MVVGMFRLIYRGVGDRTVVSGFSGRDIALVVLTWRTGPWFIVVVDWSHSVWVVCGKRGLSVICRGGRAFGGLWMQGYTD